MPYFWSTTTKHLILKIGVNKAVISSQVRIVPDYDKPLFRISTVAFFFSEEIRSILVIATMTVRARLMVDIIVRCCFNSDIELLKSVRSEECNPRVVPGAEMTNTNTSNWVAIRAIVFTYLKLPGKQNPFMKTF